MKITGYMDKVDFDEELGRAIDGSRVFPSVEALVKAKPCVDSCGIVEVEVSLVKVVRETDFTKRVNFRGKP